MSTDTIITDTHIGSVIQNGNYVLRASTDRGLAALRDDGEPGQAGSPPPYLWVMGGGDDLALGDGRLQVLDLRRLGLAALAEASGFRYDVQLIDGSPLPDGLSFDSQNLRLTLAGGWPAESEEELLLRIRLLDGEGQVLSVNELRLKAGDARPEPESPDESVEEILDQAEAALNEAAAAFRDLWLSPAETDAAAPGENALPRDNDFDQKLAQAPKTTDSLMRTAHSLFAALTRA